MAPKLSQTIRAKRLDQPQVILQASMHKGLDLVPLDAVVAAYESYVQGQPAAATPSVRLYAHSLAIIDNLIQIRRAGNAIVLRSSGGMIYVHDVSLPPEMEEAVRWALTHGEVFHIS